MVAIVSSESAGLFNSSLTTLGQQGVQGQAGHGQANERIYVNAATGNLVVQNQDARLSSIGLDFGNLRTYNSLGSIDDGVGSDQWRLGFLSSVSLSGGLNQLGSTLSRITADGAEQRFTYVSEGRYQSTDGDRAHDTIEITAEGLVYREGSSLVSMHYELPGDGGKLTAILDKEGKGTRLTYNEENRLAQATSDLESGQETTHFNYDENGALTSVGLPQGGVYSYEYDAQGRLEHVVVDLTPENATDSKEYRTTYSYISVDSQLIQNITQSEGSSLTFTYHPDGKVASVTNGENNVTTYDYADNQLTQTIDGKEYVFTYDENSKELKSKSTVVSGQVVQTSFEYDSQGNVVAIVDGLNNRIDYSYDANGNQIAQQDAQGNRIERKFNENNQLIVETLFVNPDPDGAGVQTASEPQHSHFVFDTNERLRFSLSPQGSITEYRYNSLGQRTSQVAFDESYFIGLNPQIAQTIQDLATGAASEQKALLADLVNWSETASTLNLTTYTYDVRGHLNTQTQYQSVTNQGVGLGGSTTTFTYDHKGQLLSSVSEDGRKTTYSYDGLGRLLVESDTAITSGSPIALTQYQYDDANQQIIIESSNGLHTTQTLDRAGRLISQEYGLAHAADTFSKQQFIYDSQGREVARKHANGAYSYSLFDAAGRMNFTVDQAGAVTQLHYDLAGRLTGTTQFSDLINTQSWLSGDAPMQHVSGARQALVDIKSALELDGTSPTRDTSKDRMTSYVYDDSGRKTLDIDAAGYVTEYRYDGIGQLTHSISHAEKALQNEDGSYVLQAPGNNADDRVSRRFYDVDGQLTYTVDAEGYASKFSYDGAGRLIEQLNFATPLAESTDLVALALSDIVLSTNSADQYSYFSYNSRNDIVAQVAPDGSVTRTEYTADGQVFRQTQYAERLKGYQGGDIVFPSLNSNDRTVTYTYNERGQVETETTQPQGIKTTYVYDEQGLLIGTRQGDVDDTDTQSVLFKRDEMGRVVGSLDANESNGIALNSTAIDAALAIDGVGARSQFDKAGRLISTTDREGNSTYFYYDKRELLTTTINSQGEVQTFQYNSFGELTETRTFTLRLAINALDPSALAPFSGGTIDDTLQDNIDGLASTNDSVVSQDYTLRGLVDVTTNSARGNVDNQYNAFGEVASTISTLSGSSTRTDTFDYDNRGLLLQSVVDSDGERVVNGTQYDAFGRVAQQTDAAGNSIEFSYDDAAGTTTTEYASSNGKIREIVTVDVFGRSVSIIDGEQQETTITFDDANRVQVTEDANGNGTKVEFDVHGQISDLIKGQVINNDIPVALEHTRFEYDENGNQVTQIRGFGSAQSITTTYQFDDNNRRISQTVDPAGINAKTSYRYDSEGRVISSTDANNYTTLFSYDGQGRLVYELDSANSLSHFSYDSAGRQTSRSVYHNVPAEALSLDKGTIALDVNTVDTWSKGEAATSYFNYDEAGRLIATVDAEGGVTENRYNKRGLVIEQVRYANPVIISSSQANHLVQGTFDGSLLPSASAQDQYTATVYDANGQARFSLQRLANGLAQVKESQYDASGRLVSTRAFANLIAYQPDYSVDEIQIGTNSHDRSTQLFYDNAGRLRFTVDAEQRITEQRYDNAGQLTHSVNHSRLVGEVSGLSISSLTIDSLERELNANTVEANDRIQFRSYDAAGRLESLDNLNHLDEAQSWTYYENGLKKTYTNQKGDEWRYFYDDSGRLTREIGPALEHSWTQNINDIVPSGSTHRVLDITYDDLGNILTRSEGYVTTLEEPALPNDVQITTFGYDAKGRQITVTEPTAQNAPPLTSTVTYNALDQAVVQHIATENAEGQNKSVYTYKVYDELGRLRFDVDALGFVTQYDYDALSNQTHLTRYGASLNTGAFSGWSEGEAISLAQIESEISNLGQSRVVTSEYNSLGQKISVKQPEISFSEVDAYGNVTKRLGQPETQFSYNAFGEVIQSAERIDQNDWATTHTYYDNAGNRTFQVDAQGYVSKWEYNATGEVQFYTEYANAVDRVDSSITPDVESDAKDRSWEYRYDNLGRKTHDIQLQVQVHSLNSNVWNGQNIDPTSSPENITAVTEYDDLGNITKLTQNGVTTTTDYDALGRATRITAAAVNVVDDETILINGVNAAEGTTANVQLLSEFRYDIHGNVLQTLHGTHLNAQSLLDETNANNRVTTQFYNAKNQVIKSVDALGNETQYEYDHLGNIVEQTQDYTVTKDGIRFDVAQLVELQQYNGFRQEFETYIVPQALPHWIEFDRDSGTLVGVAEDAETYTIRIQDSSRENPYTFDFTGVAGQAFNFSIPGWTHSPIKQYKSAITRVEYNDVGQQVSSHQISRDKITSAETTEQYTEIQYNAFGEVLRQGDPGFNDHGYLQEFYYYNEAGQLIQTNAGDGIVKDYQYDLQGNLVVSGQLSRGQTVSQFDSLGRVVKQFQAAFTSEGQTLQPTQVQEYDRWGNVVRFTNANNRTSYYSYNHANQLVEEKRPFVKVVRSTGEEVFDTPILRNFYDVNGRLIAHKDAETGFIFNAYDEAGQLAQTRDQVGAITRFGYNQFGERVAIENAQGYVTTQSYDQLGRVTDTGDIRKDESGSDVYQELNHFAYNELGQRIIQRNAQGYEFSQTYNTLGNVLSSLSAEGVSKTFDYDRRGNQVLEQFDGLATATQEEHKNVRIFDYFGNLESLNDLGGNDLVYTYENYQLTSKAKKSSSGDPVPLLSYTYYENGLLKRVTDKSVSVQTTQNVTVNPYSEYEYNKLGQVIKEVRMTSNALDEVRIEITHTTYDSHGRAETVTVTDGTANKILSHISYTYDAMGNRRSMDVINGYTGNVAAETDNSPILNPDYEGLNYTPLVTSNSYAQKIGDIDNIFLFNEGINLDFELQFEDGSASPSWLTIDNEALQNNELVIRTANGSKVPVGTLDLDLVVKVIVQDGKPEEFTLLPIYLPVVENLSPLFINQSGFGALDILEVGESYPTQELDMHQFIKDPEGTNLTFSIDWSDSHSVEEIASFASWFVFTPDSNFLNNGEVTFSLVDGATVPESMLGQTIEFDVIATDASGKSTKFDLVFKGTPLQVEIPDEPLELIHDGTNQIDLYDFITGDISGVNIEVIELEGGTSHFELIQGHILQVKSEFAVTDVSREVKIRLYRLEADDSETQIYSKDTVVNIDVPPQLPSTDLLDKWLTPVTLSDTGDGYFWVPNFTDLNDDALEYEFDFVTNDPGLEIWKVIDRNDPIYSDPKPFQKVYYRPTLPEFDPQHFSGDIRITVRQKDNPTVATTFDTTFQVANKAPEKFDPDSFDAKWNTHIVNVLKEVGKGEELYLWLPRYEDPEGGTLSYNLTGVDSHGNEVFEYVQDTDSQKDTGVTHKVFFKVKDNAAIGDATFTLTVKDEADNTTIIGQVSGRIDEPFIDIQTQNKTVQLNADKPYEKTAVDWNLKEEATSRLDVTNEVTITTIEALTPLPAGLRIEGDQLVGQVDYKALPVYGGPEDGIQVKVRFKDTASGTETYEVFTLSVTDAAFSKFVDGPLGTITKGEEFYFWMPTREPDGGTDATFTVEAIGYPDLVFTDNGSNNGTTPSLRRIDYTIPEDFNVSNVTFRITQTDSSGIPKVFTVNAEIQERAFDVIQSERTFYTQATDASVWDLTSSVNATTTGRTAVVEGVQFNGAGQPAWLDYDPENPQFLTVNPPVAAETTVEMKVRLFDGVNRTFETFTLQMSDNLVPVAPSDALLQEWLVQKGMQGSVEQGDTGDDYFFWLPLWTDPDNADRTSLDYHVSSDNGITYTTAEFHNTDPFIKVFYTVPTPTPLGAFDIDIYATDSLDGQSEITTVSGNAVVMANQSPTLHSYNGRGTSEDSSITLSLSDFNYTDNDTAANQLQLFVNGGSHYSVLNDRTIVPREDFNGSLSVSAYLYDPLSDSTSNTLNFSVGVSSVNDPLIITNDSVGPFTEDTAKTLYLSNFTFTDVDYSSGHTLEVQAGSNYSFSGNRVTPSSNYHGTLNINVRIKDPGGAYSQPYVVNTIVTPVAESPEVKTYVGGSMTEDTPKTLSISDFTICDPDHSSGFKLLVQNGSNYSRSGNTITPNSNFNGTLDVNVVVEDPDGNLSPTFVASIAVNNVNDAPVPSPSSAILTVNEDKSGNVVLSASDPEGTSLSWRVYSGPANGSVSFSGSGSSRTFTYTPSSNYHGPDSFTVEVTDGQIPVYIPVSVTVNSVNDGPTRAPGISSKTYSTKQEASGFSAKLTDLFVDPDGPQSQLYVDSIADISGRPSLSPYFVKSGNNIVNARDMDDIPDGKYSGRVYVKDAHGDVANIAIAIVVDGKPFTTNGIPLLRATQGDILPSVDLNNHFDDIRDNKLSYRILPGSGPVPSNVHISGSSLQGTISNYQNPDAYTFKVEAKDDLGQTTTTNVSILVKAKSDGGTVPNFAPSVIDSKLVSLSVESDEPGALLAASTPPETEPELSTASQLELLSVASTNVSQTLTTSAQSAPDTLNYSFGDGAVLYAYSGELVRTLNLVDRNTQELAIYEDGQDYIVRFLDNQTDSLRIADIVNRIGNLQIEFQDGQIWDDATIRANLSTSTLGDGSTEILEGTVEDDLIIGGGGLEIINGFAGDDVLIGTEAKNSFAGGTGNDRFSGGAGNDTYFYNLGDGNDIIYDQSGTDQIKFGASITPQNILLTADQQDIFIRVPDGSVITFKNWRNSSLIALESIAFEDGTVWDVRDIGRNLIISGTEGDDTWLDNSAKNVELGHRGGLGDDIINGGKFSDRYYYALGDGNDVITDALGLNDKLIFAEGITQEDVTITADQHDLFIHLPDGAVITFKDWREKDDLRLDYIEFADGSIWDDREIGRRLVITGTDGDDIWLDNSDRRVELGHRGGLGDDTIFGGSFSDRYYYSLGDGNDVISDTNGTNDRLIFGDGITPENVQITGDQQDLFIHLPDGATITVKKWRESDQFRLDYIEFADGTVWDDRAIGRRFVITGTDGNDIWTDNSDRRVELGHRGGLGDDTISGGRYADRYYYSLGDGNDVITDANGTKDKLILGEGITPDDIQITGNQQDMFVHMPDGATITFKNWRESKELRLEYIEFFDGTVWGERDIGRHFVIVGTDGNDTWLDNSDRHIELGHRGGLGDDFVRGGVFSDTYHYALGDGNDVISDASGAKDKLNFSQIASSEVSFYQDLDDLLIHIKTSDHVIKVQSHFVDTNRIEQFNFSDTSLSHDSVASLLEPVPANFAPGKRAIPNIDAYVLEAFNHDLSQYFSDFNGDPLSLSMEMIDAQGQATGAALPVGLSFDAATGLLSGMPEVFGTYYIKVTADDGQATNSNTFTLNIKDSNVAPDYTGSQTWNAIAGDFVRIPVEFIDANNNALTISASGLPEWLSLNTATNEVTGFAPIDFTGDIQFNVEASDGLLSSNIDLTLTISERPSQNQEVVVLGAQNASFNNAFNYSVAEQFAHLEAPLNYIAELQQPDGGYLPLSETLWLQFSEGAFSGTPQLGDVTDGLQIRVTTTNAVNDSAIVAFKLTVAGPASRSVGTIEAVQQQAIDIDVRSYFSGLSSQAQYGIVIELPSESTPEQQSLTESASLVKEPSQEKGEIQPIEPVQTMSLSNTLSAPKLAFEMDNFSVASTTESTQEATSEPDLTPDVIIPPELADWLSFDPQTGRLQGTPPAEYIADLKLTFLARDGITSLETNGNLIVDEEATQQAYWFTYDAAGRVQIDGGFLDRGALNTDGTDNYSDNVISISSQGQFLEYNEVGQVEYVVTGHIAAYSAQKLHYSAQGYLVSTQFSNDTNLGNLDMFGVQQARDWTTIGGWSTTNNHEYNLLGQKTRTINYFSANEPDITLPGGEAGTQEAGGKIAGQMSDFQDFVYNKDGQVAEATQFGFAGDSLETLFQSSPYYTIQLTDIKDKLHSTSYQYDTLGRLDMSVQQQFERPEIAGSSFPSQYTHQYQYRFEGRESYLESEVAGRNTGSTGGDGTFDPVTTKSFYDDHGNRIAVEETTMDPSNTGEQKEGTRIQGRYFDYSADGKLVRKQSGSSTDSFKEYSYIPPAGQTGETAGQSGQLGLAVKQQMGFEENVAASHYMYQASQYLGELREDGIIRVKQQHFSGIDTKGESNQRHQVVAGDSLRSLATLYYGNGDYWYIIADANGLSEEADAQLTGGQSLEIPQVQSNENRFDTFTPYSVIEQIGDTVPNLPFIPTPPEAGCNALATIIIIAVTIIVTVSVGPEGGMSFWEAAGAAALGNTAGQATGIVLGVQDGFDLGSVAVSALTAGVAQGTTNALGGNGFFATGAENTASISNLNAWEQAAVGASRALATAATNKIVGRPSNFSWANVAAGAVLEPVGQYVGAEIASGISDPILRGFTSGAINSTLRMHTTRALGVGGKIDYAQVAADAFGNALANSVVSRQTQVEQHQAQSDAIGRIGSDAVGTRLNDSKSRTGQTSQQLDQIARNAAIDASRIALESVPSSPIEDIQPFSLTSNGIAFAEKGTIGLRALNDGIRLKEFSIDRALDSIEQFARVESRYRLGKAPVLSGVLSEADIQKAKVARLIEAASTKPRRLASGLSIDRFRDIQQLNNNSATPPISQPLWPTGSYSGLIPVEGDPALAFSLSLGGALPFGHGEGNILFGFEPDGTLLINGSASGGGTAQFDWSQWGWTSGVSGVRTFNGSANDLVTGLSGQHSLSFDGIDFGATSVDFSLIQGETIPLFDETVVNFEGFGVGSNFGRRGFTQKLDSLTNDLPPSLRNVSYSSGVEYTPFDPISLDVGTGGYDFAQSAFYQFDNIFKAGAVINRVLFASPGAFAAPLGHNPYFIQTSTTANYQNYIELLKNQGR